MFFPLVEIVMLGYAIDANVRFLVAPTTWTIDASRGVILRAAGWRELWPHALVLTDMATAWIVYSSLKFQKRVTN